MFKRHPVCNLPCLCPTYLPPRLLMSPLNLQMSWIHFLRGFRMVGWPSLSAPGWDCVDADRGPHTRSWSATVPPQTPWSPTAHAFAHHQLSHVTYFWKQGHQASFGLEALPGGQAELHLTLQLPPASEVVPLPSHVFHVPPQRPTHPLFPIGCSTQGSASAVIWLSFSEGPETVYIAKNVLKMWQKANHASSP